MFRIGILGEEDSMDVSHMIKTFYKGSSLISIEFLTQQHHLQGVYEIIIINKPLPSFFEFTNHLDKNSFVILNSDHKEINKLLNNIQCRILSYGLNSKACVTASSVTETPNKTILCCIQRCLPTFLGNNILQQEFSVDALPTSQINNILCSVTTALVLDVTPEQISNIRLCK